MSNETVVDAEPVGTDIDTGEDTAMTQSTALALTTSRDLTLADDTYSGIAAFPVTAEQANILNRDLTDADIDLRPDGLVYMSHAKLRQRLNQAFKPGGWALRRLTPVVRTTEVTTQGDKKTQYIILSAEFALYANIEGTTHARFLASARGEHKWQDNGEMTFGDALESAKSNALSRCCKDLGIALDLWDRRYADAWRAANCIKVWVEGGRKPQWRRVDEPHFYKETGMADDSPNRDKYIAPPPRGGSSRDTSTRAERNDTPAPGQTSAPAPSAPRPSGNGSERKISDAQRNRLFAHAKREGADTQAYRDILAGFGIPDDREILMKDYDDVYARVMTAARALGSDRQPGEEG